MSRVWKFIVTVSLKSLTYDLGNYYCTWATLNRLMNDTPTEVWFWYQYCKYIRISCRILRKLMHVGLDGKGLVRGGGHFRGVVGKNHVKLLMVKNIISVTFCWIIPAAMEGIIPYKQVE